MARPRVKDIDKRTVQVNIRLTESEDAKANAYAQASGMTQANWIRYVAFNGKFPPVKLSTIDAAVYRELRKIGVNLNQITHKINQGNFSEEYIKCHQELEQLLQRLLNALNP